MLQRCGYRQSPELIASCECLLCTDVRLHCSEGLILAFMILSDTYDCGHLPRSNSACDIMVFVGGVYTIQLEIGQLSFTLTLPVASLNICAPRLIFQLGMNV